MKQFEKVVKMERQIEKKNYEVEKEGNISADWKTNLSSLIQ